MGKFQDLTGQRFGRLVALERVEGRNGRKMWLCQCDCGNTKAVMAGSLTKGDTQSCGCLQKELLSQRAKTHGKSGSRIFWIWRDIKLRCYVPSNNSYNRYGGRGIKVCDEWLGENGAENFINWAMNNGYADNLTIDRKDNDGNYEPSNCRWVTPKEQANNRRSSIYITFNGKTQTKKQWAEEYGIKYSTLKMRLGKYHWSVEKALTTPIQKHKIG